MYMIEALLSSECMEPEEDRHGLLGEESKSPDSLEAVLRQVLNYS